MRGGRYATFSYMKNQDIAAIFNEIAQYLEIRDDNPFKIRAYRKAALNIESLSVPVEEMAEEDRLEEIPGIGKDLALKVREFLSTGRVQHLEDLKRETPQGLLTLLEVQGIGPRTARHLYDTFGIESIEQLEQLAREHKLAGLPGIKEKTEDNILKGIEFLKQGRDRFPLGVALPLAEEVIEHLKELKTVMTCTAAGSVRRRKETVRDVDILVTAADPVLVTDAFVGMPSVKQILSHGSTRSSVILDNGLQMDLRVVDPSSYGAALCYFTGSKAHNIRLREMGVAAGLKINEYGIFDVATDRRLGGEKEEDLYRLLGLSYVPPELREDTGEIEAARDDQLPRLVELDDLRGDFHVHSTHSDGNQSILQMAAAARELGLEYFVLTDHTRSLGVARGLKEEDLMAQRAEIDEVNRKLKGFTVLHGAEVNVLSDGSLDVSDEVLARLDFVVASIHSGFTQSKEQMTRRAVAAMENPHVDLLGHPTGRLLGQRKGYDIDMDEVIKAARRTGTALEINAYPARLDITDIACRKAKEAGVTLAIATDAHQIDQFRNLEYGVWVARRGWLGKKNLLNCLSLNQLAARKRKDTRRK